MPPSAAPSLPKIPLAPDTATFSLLRPFASVEKPFMAEPMPLIVLPRITRKGPAAATIPAMAMMVFCVSGGSPVSESTKAVTFSTSFDKNGIT